MKNRNHSLTILGIAAFFATSCTTQLPEGAPSSQTQSPQTKVQAIDLGGSWSGTASVRLVPEIIEGVDWVNDLGALGLFDCSEVKIFFKEKNENLNIQSTFDCANYDMEPGERIPGPFYSLYPHYSNHLNIPQSDTIKSATKIVMSENKINFPLKVEENGIRLIEIGSINGNQVTINAVGKDLPDDLKKDPRFNNADNFRLTGTITQVDTNTLDYSLEIKVPNVRYVYGEVSGRLTRK